VSLTRSLAVVMPVYNEEDCITEVLYEWLNILEGFDIDFELFVLDDGSTDGTRQKLEWFRTHERVSILHLHNQGHGPTILQGYRLAVDRAHWVFQTDSDGEIGSCFFPELWGKRKDYDAILGVRIGRKQTIVRTAISIASRISVKCLYAPGVTDVNVPYRLMRSEILKEIITGIPRDSFAPNVIISGLLALQKARIFNYPVFCTGRKSGLTSLTSVRLLKGAYQSFMQLAALKPKVSKPSAPKD